MSFGFSIGDFIALSTLLKTTISRCRNASTDLQELSSLLHSAWASVEVARGLVADIYDEIPLDHKTGLAAALDGLHTICEVLEQDLDRYAGPGNKVKVLKFALLTEPAKAEEKVNRRLTALNTSISLLILHSVTKPQIQTAFATVVSTQAVAGASPSPTSSSPTARTGSSSSTASSPPAASRTPPSTSKRLDSSPSVPSQDLPATERWRQASESTSINKQPIRVRGYYDHTGSDISDKHFSDIVPKLDKVNYTLYVDNGRLVGASEDTIGFSEIDGTIDFHTGAVCFIKSYTKFRRIKHRVVGLLYRSMGLQTKWEYTGTLTSCGIVGEWHYPGDPKWHAFQRGSFAMWLLEDEEARGEELAEQLNLLCEGKIMKRSLTVREVVVE